MAGSTVQSLQHYVICSIDKVNKVEFPKYLKTPLQFMLLGITVMFTVSGFWGLYEAVADHQNLITVKIVGNALDGIRLIGQNSLAAVGGNHVLTIVLLGCLGVALVSIAGIRGFFRWLWVFGWHEELWVLSLTLVYLKYLNLQWVSPLIFSWSVLFIVATIFWGHLSKRDFIFVGISAIYFVIWGTLGGMGISSCISTAPFVVNCSNTISNNWWEVGSWIWMIGIAVATWLIDYSGLQVMSTGIRIRWFEE